MEFRTNIKIRNPKHKINYQLGIMTLGSCFSNEIGKRLETIQFKTSNNHLGISFNPLSVVKHLDFMIKESKFTKESLIIHQGSHFHHDFHGKFSSENPDNLIKDLNQTVSIGHQTLKSIDTLILTLGTAFVFRRKKDGWIVNNCHKQNQDQFERILLSSQEISIAFKECVQKLLKFNPRLKIILTLSPVRHIRDGLVENQRSKAHLLVAIHDIVDTFSSCSYFESYELLMDELRDYRFYKEDMIHPTKQAVDFIINRFVENYMDEETQDYIQSFKKLQNQFLHKVLQPGTQMHADFLIRLKANVNQFIKSYPHVDFSMRLKEIEQTWLLFEKE